MLKVTTFSETETDKNRRRLRFKKRYAKRKVKATPEVIVGAAQVYAGAECRSNRYENGEGLNETPLPGNQTQSIAERCRSTLPFAEAMQTQMFLKGAPIMGSQNIK